jgi:pSer/pThr/pTyr-binding forkhead associated (FHA) protein
MQIVLVMFRNDGQRRSFSLHKPQTVLGRREDCDVRIPLSEISRKHCRLVRDEAGLHVEDCGSSNGTFVNGHRVQRKILQPGDTVQVGPVAFVVQIDGMPAEEELSPRLNASPLVSPDAPTVAAEQRSPSETFDPASILSEVEDSRGGEVLDSSQLADDIAADLDRAEQAR